jgi:hypothetical protein
LVTTVQDFSGLRDTGRGDHHTVADWDIQAHPATNIHLKLLVDKELDQRLVSHMMGSPSEIGLVDSLHMPVVPQVEECGFRIFVGAEAVSFGIHNLGFYGAMPASQLEEMERGSS